MLVVVYTFNFIDRQIVAILAVPLAANAHDDHEHDHEKGRPEGRPFSSALAPAQRTRNGKFTLKLLREKGGTRAPRTVRATQLWTAGGTPRTWTFRTRPELAKVIAALATPLVP